MYVNVMVGVLWAEIDIFMALVIGPILGSLNMEERVSWIEKFTTKMIFLLSTLARVTIFSGITSGTSWNFSKFRVLDWIILIYSIYLSYLIDGLRF